MENSEKKPQGTEDANHPKPTEDIQMSIETVTPDTDKEGLPNTQEHNHKSEKSQVEETTDKEDDNGEDSSDESTEEASNENSEDSDEKPGDDKRDEIETTSP